MTGPEHYREAQRLLDGTKTERGAIRTETGNDLVIAAAQVHATLALAAATALIDETPRSDCFDNYRAWQQVAGGTKGGSA